LIFNALRYKRWAGKMTMTSNTLKYTSTSIALILLHTGLSFSAVSRSNIEKISTQFESLQQGKPENENEGSWSKLLTKNESYIEVDPKNMLRDISIFEGENQDSRFLYVSIASDMQKLSKIYSKLKTDLILDKLFEGRKLPFFCKRLKDSKSIRNCKKNTKKLLGAIDESSDFEVVLFEGKGEFYEDSFSFISLYIESNTQKNYFLNLVFDIYHTEE